MTDQKNRARRWRTGKYAKEPQFPQRITGNYAASLAHRAMVRITFPEFREYYPADVLAEASRILFAARAKAVNR